MFSPITPLAIKLSSWLPDYAFGLIPLHLGKFVRNMIMSFTSKEYMSNTDNWDKIGGVLVLDTTTGDIIDEYYEANCQNSACMHEITSVLESASGDLYFGSLTNDFIGQFPLKSKK